MDLAQTWCENTFCRYYEAIAQVCCLWSSFFLAWRVSENTIFSDDRAIASNNHVAAASVQKSSLGYAPLPAKGHKESVYALSMNGMGTILVSGGTEKVSCTFPAYFIRKVSIPDYYSFTFATREK